jgi:hypothetical protein
MVFPLVKLSAITPAISKCKIAFFSKVITNLKVSAMPKEPRQVQIVGISLITNNEAPIVNDRSLSLTFCNGTTIMLIIPLLIMP